MGERESQRDHAAGRHKAMAVKETRVNAVMVRCPISGRLVPVGVPSREARERHVRLHVQSVCDEAAKMKREAGLLGMPREAFEDIDENLRLRLAAMKKGG